MPNRILAIDPGFDRVGIAVMEKVDSKEKIIYSDCVETDRKAVQAERLRQIGEAVRKVIEKYKPKELAIEKLFFNQNITTGIRVAEARGVMLYEAARGGLEVFEYNPQQIKMAVTGYGKASKPDLLRMVKRLTALKPATKHDDEIDAVGVGITHLASRRSI
jgi:crossover junction endodeoxyribonuclease RuvC